MPLSDDERFVDELLDSLRAEVADRVAERVRHGLPPADRPAGELARMMGALLPRRSPWDEAVGPFYDTSGAATVLGISRQALKLRRDRHQLVALRTADGAFVYPTWQFGEDRRVLAGLAAVLAAIPPGAADDWTLAAWLRTSRLGELDGRTVVEHLAGGGDPAPAVLAARRTAARWAA